MELINTHLIGKHLPAISGETLTEPCAICGALPDKKLQGLQLKEVIGSSFMDHQYLGGTKYICCYCAVCIGRGQAQNKQIRLFSFIATESNLTLLKREEIWAHIFTPPSEPFVFGVTYSHKKHISFKAPVCFPGDSYQIQTDNGSTTVDLCQIQKLGKTIQGWYSICKDTKQEPTWFTKAEIENGCNNFKRIEEYGVDDYFKENSLIAPFRGRSILQLLSFALNKGGLSERKSAKIDISCFISTEELKQKSEQLTLF